MRLPSVASDEVGEHPIQLVRREPRLSPIEDRDGGTERHAVGLQLVEEPLTPSPAEVRQGVPSFRGLDAGDTLLGTGGV